MCNPRSRKRCVRQHCVFFRDVLQTTNSSNWLTESSVFKQGTLNLLISFLTQQGHRELLQTPDLAREASRPDIWQQRDICTICVYFCCDYHQTLSLESLHVKPILLTPMASFYTPFKSHTTRGKQASANSRPDSALQRLCVICTIYSWPFIIFILNSLQKSSS